MGYLFRKWLAGALAVIFTADMAVFPVVAGLWAYSRYPATWGFASLFGFLVSLITAVPTIAIMDQWEHDKGCDSRKTKTVRAFNGDARSANLGLPCNCLGGLQRFWYGNSARPRVEMPASTPPDDVILREANDIVEKRKPLNWR